MTALDHRTPAARTDAVAARATDALRGLLRALANRRVVDRLDGLSDRGLADIGLMRADLSFARHVPLGTDPTARLAAVARERVRSLRGGRG